MKNITHSERASTPSHFLYFLLFLLFGCQPNHPTADLIVLNGNIWTGNPTAPKATAFAVVKDKIVEIGSNAQMEQWKGPNTQIVDAAGKMIVPGFIDAHVHFMAGGFNLLSVKLRGTRSKAEFIQKMSDFAATQPKGTWIRGGEWDQSLWGGELPDKAWIDGVTPDHPVFVQRLDGHMGLANSAALKMAGIDRNTPDPDGGQILRDAQGEPTGILKDNAMNLLDAFYPPPTQAEFDKALQAAMQFVAQQGVTSVHHVAGLEYPAEYDAYQNARNQGQLITRMYVMAPLKDANAVLERMAKSGKGDEWLKWGGLKGFVDGSLGSHTAVFKEPYDDHPHDKGIYITPKDSLSFWVARADKAGLQVAVHAIGDAAIHFILNTYEQVAKENGERDRRFRIEHAQHIAPSDIARFAQLKVIPSMQPYHCIDDGRWAEKSIGPERIKTTYAFRSLWDTGATVAFGSDWYVAPPTPLEGIYAAVTRRTLDDKNPNGWVPEQKITVAEALAGYTRNAAFASFDEQLKGSLEKGKLADFVLLSEDLFNIAPEKIREVQIEATYVGGKKVFGQ